MSIIKHVTLQKIVAHDFRYDPRKTESIYMNACIYILISILEGYYIFRGNRIGAVDTATRYGLDGPGSEPR